MRALFCYDGPFYKDEEGFYYGRNLNDRMFERYFKVADFLEIVIRTRSIRQSEAIKSMSRIENPKISVTECPNLSSINGMLTQVPNATKLLKKRILEADVVFIRLPSNIGNFAVSICKKLKKKYLIEVVGCPWDGYWNYSLQGKFFALPAKLIMERNVKTAPFVVYVTNEFLQDKYPTKGRKIGCSNVELTEIQETVIEKRIERIRTYSTETKYVIGTAAGVDVLFKGQEYVIKALGKLKRKGIVCFEYRLVGGGTGERLMKIAQECGVAEQVNIMGQVPHAQVFDWLDEIDIYAQPSRQEGLPRAMIEAMSRGLPCIGAKTAGIPELIEDKYVFSNSHTEIDEICEILLGLIENHSEMKRVAIRNFEEAKNYQRESLIERRTNFFKEFVES